MGGPMEYSKPTLDEIMAQTPPENTSVYVGGVPPGATGFILKQIWLSGICLELDIRDTFKKFGVVVDIRHFKPQGYAFVSTFK